MREMGGEWGVGENKGVGGDGGGEMGRIKGGGMGR